MPESAGTQVLGSRGAALKVRRGTLAVVAGPDAGKSVAIGGQPVKLGTAVGNTLVLTDPTVSRAHIEISPGPEGPQIVDLGSTNGTFVDGNRIKEAWLRSGAEVTLGETKLAFKPEEAVEEI